MGHPVEEHIEATLSAGKGPESLGKVIAKALEQTAKELAERFDKEHPDWRDARRAYSRPALKELHVVYEAAKVNPAAWEAHRARPRPGTASWHMKRLNDEMRQWVDDELVMIAAQLIKDARKRMETQ